MEGVHSNIVMIEVIKPGLTASELCTRASQVSTHIHIDMEGVNSYIVMIEVIKPGLTAGEF